MLDDACGSWASHENALGLSGMYKYEFTQPVDQLAGSSATSLPNHWQNDTYFSSPPLLHQQLPFNTAMPASYYATVCAAAMHSRAEESTDPHSVQDSHPVRKSTPRSMNKYVGASRSRTQPMATYARHTPYPLGPGGTRRAAFPTSFYLCQWSDGGGPCGEVLTGTKNAIGQHLQSAHAIRLTADRTSQVCLWSGCRKPMRRESIARHVLAVHMKDKVHCSSCGSQYARPDSLRRHQKTCQVNEEDVSDACKAGERTRLPQADFVENI